MLFPPPGHKCPGYKGSAGQAGFKKDARDGATIEYDVVTTRDLEKNLPYWQLFYHAIWATRYREPLISPDLEPFLHGLLRGKATGLGAEVFALNGMEDHVHLVISIPPKLAVAELIGKVKGASSARLNKSGRLNRPFYWQEEYAVLSFDSKRLPRYVAYVRNQKAHHARAELIPILERSGEIRRDTPPEAISSDAPLSSNDEAPDSFSS